MNNLTEQQKNFVEEYIKCLNPTEAAQKAGYQKSRAKYQGKMLLQRDYILCAVKDTIASQIQSLQVSKAYIVKKLLDIIEFSLEQDDILDKDGTKTGKTKLRDTQSSLRALDFLCKHLGMASCESIIDDVEPKITIIDNLDRKKI